MTKFCECDVCKANRNDAVFIIGLFYPTNLMHIAAFINAYLKFEPFKNNRIGYVELFNTLTENEFNNIKKLWEKQHGTSKEEIDFTLQEVERKVDGNFDLKNFLNHK